MLHRHRTAAVALFVAGVAVGAFAASKITVTPAAWSGKKPAAAADDLLAAAKGIAKDGSYENIAVARVYFRAGRKAEGQEILDRVAAGKTKAGDIMRIARVHQEAGQWAVAKPLFDSVVQMEPKDEDWLAEIGAYYLLAGDRAHAEELFARSFAEDPTNLRNTLRVACGYLGLAPDV
jgi:tetratricopeptide (TPR) repeat protein